MAWLRPERQFVRPRAQQHYARQLTGGRCRVHRQVMDKDNGLIPAVRWNAFSRRRKDTCYVVSDP